MSANLHTVAGHVLLPHQADWSVTPKVSRMWRSPVDTAQSGLEDRVSVRPVSWKILQYQILPYDHVERARLDERCLAGLKAGKIAVPSLGNGATLESDAEEDSATIVLSRTTHGITEGQYVFIQQAEPAEYDTWDLGIASIVDGAIISLVSPLGNSYLAGVRVWPLLFGKPTFQQYPVMNSARARYFIEVQYDGRVINPIAEDTFESYSTGGLVSPLSGGSGWASPWEIGEMV